MVSVASMVEKLRLSLALLLLTANIGVILGVYWEGERFPKHVQDFAWKLLLFCLAVEAADGFELFSLDTAITNEQSLQIAQLKRDEAEATESAAKFAKEAQQLKVDLETEEHKRASRYVSESQLNTLVKELEKIGGPLFLVCRDEDEPRKYCNRFSLALTNANLINDAVAHPAFTTDHRDNWTGIKLYTPTISDRKNPQDDPFVRAFSEASIPICGVCYETMTCTLLCHNGDGVVISVGPSGNGVVPSAELNRPMRTIYVGQKPLPD
jgi:hypothetical protein